MFLGAGAGTMVMPSVAQWLIAGFGWRFAYYAIGAAILAITVPVISVLLRDTPEEVGRLPHGVKARRTPSSAYRPPVAQLGEQHPRGLPHLDILAIATRCDPLSLPACMHASVTCQPCLQSGAVLVRRSALASSLFAART
jgi:MFS family permease